MSSPVINWGKANTGKSSDMAVSPGLPNRLKGLQPRAPKAEGPQSQDKKIHIEFDRRHAMQCFMCVQCMVIVDCRVSAVFTRAE